MIPYCEGRCTMARNEQQHGSKGLEFMGLEDRERMTAGEMTDKCRC
jgi:hypothetical protein